MTNKKTSKTIPAGFTKADTDLDSFAPWDFDTEGELSGVIQKIKTVPVERRGEVVDTRVAVVATEGGELRNLWESANLQDFFNNIDVGSEVLVIPTGTEALSKGRTMRTYDAYFK